MNGLGDIPPRTSVPGTPGLVRDPRTGGLVKPEVLFRQAPRRQVSEQPGSIYYQADCRKILLDGSASYPFAAGQTRLIKYSVPPGHKAVIRSIATKFTRPLAMLHIMTFSLRINGVVKPEYEVSAATEAFLGDVFNLIIPADATLELLVERSVIGYTAVGDTVEAKISGWIYPAALLE